MLKLHKLTDEELEEVYKIGKLIGSKDEESKELGIGLLKLYPQDIKTRDLDLNYSPTLKYLISEYENDVHFNFFGSFFKKDIYPIISFICNLLIEQQYYYEEAQDNF